MIHQSPINIRSKVKVTGSKSAKKSRRDSRAAQCRCDVSVTPLNETAPHGRRELCTLSSAQPFCLRAVLLISFTLQDLYIMMTIILLTAIACWNGLSTHLRRASVKSVDKIAAFVFIAVFCVIQLAFYLFVTKQVTHPESVA